MAASSYASSTDWFCEGPQASYVRARKSSGGVLNLLEMARPGGQMSQPALPDLVLHQDLVGGSRVRGDSGAGHFDVASTKNGCYLASPNFANTVLVSTNHRLRSVSFPVVQWQPVLDDAADARLSLDDLKIHKGTFHSQAIQSALSSLWAICDEEGAPSRLLARAAGCEILAELCRIGGEPLVAAKGGLAPWAKRRCVELMRAKFAEDISLDDLAAEARLSPFHFARMFKQSIGVPPRVYLTRLRMERACELLETTDLPVTQIAFEVGYSSNQVLARVFTKHRRMSPIDYRRAVRDPLRATA